MKQYIEKQLHDAVKLKQAIAQDPTFVTLLDQVVNLCVDAYAKGNKVMAAGNGGSAADAQHIVAEFVSRFYFDRPALAAEALTVNTSILTAIGNDYGYERLFSRQIEANGKPGDIFFALSTSGNSPNVLLAAEAARTRGITIVGFTGAKGGKLAPLCDICLKVPSNETPRIQEGHILFGHVICAAIEEVVYGKEKKV